MQDQVLAEAACIHQVLQVPLLNHPHRLALVQQLMAGGVSAEMTGAVEDPCSAVRRLRIAEAHEAWITERGGHPRVRLGALFKLLNR